MTEFFIRYLEIMPDPAPLNYLTYAVDCNRLYWAYVRFTGHLVSKKDFWAGLKAYAPRAEILDGPRGKEFINVRFIGIFGKKEPARPLAAG
jgi:hypothetical protein